MESPAGNPISPTFHNLVLVFRFSSALMLCLMPEVEIRATSVVSNSVKGQ